MTAIYQRELRAYFSGMFGWCYLALWLAVGGVFTAVYNLVSSSSDLTYLLQQSILLLVLTLPFLAAKCFEERSSAGMELWLASLPVSRKNLILGKYFAALTVYAIPVLFTALYPPLLANYGTVSYGAAYTALGGFFVMGAAWLAVCFFVGSRVCRFRTAVLLNLLFGVILYLLPLLATLLSYLPLVGFAVCVLAVLPVGVVIGLRRRSWLVGILLSVLPTALFTVGYFLLPTVYTVWIPKGINALSLFARFDGFCAGHLDLPAAVFYLGILVLSICFVVQYPAMQMKKGGAKR